MIGRSTACERYRGILVDLVDHGERGPGTAEALDHLGVCRTCDRELTEIALTITALRRTGGEARAVPLPVIAEEAVRQLAVPRRAAWSWRLQLGSLLAGAAIAAVAVAPWVGVGPRTSGAVSLVQEHPVVMATWLAAEARLAARPDRSPVLNIGTLPSRYPDGQYRPWKEVPQTDATLRGFEPS
jgi:hypothetical protein